MDTTQVIDELAKKFGATGEYLVKELARYNIAIDIVSIIIAILIAVACGIAAKILYKKVKKDKWGDYVEAQSIGVFLGIIGCICATVIFIYNIVDCIGWIVSPTAGAINYIMR